MLWERNCYFVQSRLRITRAAKYDIFFKAGRNSRNFSGGIVNVAKMSIIDPLSCGFVKIGSYVILTTDTPLQQIQSENKKVFNGRVYNYRYRELKQKYGDIVNSVDYKTFIRNFPKIVENVRGLAKRNPTLRDQLLECFSLQAWFNLTPEKKKKHTFQNCLGCQEQHLQQLTLFPVKKASLKIKAEKSGLFRKKEIKVCCFIIKFK